MYNEAKDEYKNQGKKIPESPGELALSVYTSLAQCYKTAIQDLEKITGKKYPAISIIGGGSKDAYLNALTAEYTGKTVYAGPAEATAAEGGEESQGGISAILQMVLPFVLIIGVFYFMMIRPQRKREKETQDMRSKIEVGDEIVTSGGIVGRVVSIKEDSVVLETGSDRSKIRIMRWAIQTNNTIYDDVESK